MLGLPGTKGLAKVPEGSGIGCAPGSGAGGSIWGGLGATGGADCGATVGAGCGATVGAGWGFNELGMLGLALANDITEPKPSTSMTFI